MSDQLERYIQQAELQRNNGHVDGAIESLRQCLSLDPDHAEAHALLALCLLSQRRLHAAGMEADMALALEPGLEIAHYAMANICIAARKFKDAEQHLRLLLEHDPNEAMYYRNMATLYDMTDQRNKVLQQLEKALELDPQDPETLADLSEYYMNTDLNRAEAYARNALQLSPENETALIAMGHILLARKNYSDAKQHAIWVLRNNPDSVPAIYLLSAIKTKTNWFLGLWWRYNAWTIKVGSVKAILVLLGAFICYKIAVIVSHDLQRENLASLINITWLAIVAYSFAGPMLFNRSLKKELANIELNDHF